MSIVAPDPDGKTASRLKRTRHLFHSCQDGRGERIALCGDRRQLSHRAPSWRGEVDTQTCVVCVDLAHAFHWTGCSQCGAGAA